MIHHFFLSVMYVCIGEGQVAIYNEEGLDRLILLLHKEREQVIEYATVKVLAIFYRQGK